MMKGVGFTYWIAAAALIAPAGASAQVDQTGSRVPGVTSSQLGEYGQPDGPPVAQSSAKAMEAGRALAGCMAARHTNLVDAYLQAPDAQTRERAYRRLDPWMSSCMTTSISRFSPTEMSFGGSSFSGLLAEAMLRTRPTATMESVAAPKRDYAAAWVSAEPTRRVVDEMAACLAEMQPQRASALVQTAPGTAAEKAAFSELMPYAGPCLATGATLKTDLTGMRLSVANALYHRQLGLSGGAASALAGKN